VHDIGKVALFNYHQAMKYNASLITIGVSCFNAEDTIARAMKSVLEQDWPNTEIIVVDDCSSDSSVEILNEIAKLDKRIKLIQHKKNGGLPTVLNTIIKHAKGKYIAFFDSDDESVKTRVTKQYQRLKEFEENNPGVPVICYTGRRIFVDGVEQHLSRLGYRGFKGIGHSPPEPHGDLFAKFAFVRIGPTEYSWGTLGTCMTMASKKVLRQFGYDPQMRRSEDTDLALRLTMAGGYLISVDEPLLLQHMTKAPYKGAENSFLETDLMRIEKHKEYLKGEKIYRAAIMHAHARHYRTRNIFKSIFFLTVTIFLAPRVLMGTMRAVMNKHQ
jgi:glycosyltransferase involved in cell wall biosynthesis